MIAKPYKKIIRPNAEGKYLTNLDRTYITDRRYSENRFESLQAYHSLEHDLKNLFDYVSPYESNLTAFSFRIYDLLLRVCTELEQNWKSILIANEYADENERLNIHDYKKIEQSSRLSEYEVEFNYFQPRPVIIKPFNTWATNDPLLVFYDAYNKSKHNRVKHFPKANLKNVIDAMAALIAVLVSQYHILAFSPYGLITTYRENNSFISYGDSLFSVKLASSWSETERYESIEKSENPFDPYSYFNFQ